MSQALFRVESCFLHGDADFGVACEGAPDEAGTEVFGHQDTDALINAEYVCVVPVDCRMERIAEAVASPGLFAVVLFEGAEDFEAVGGQERE